MLYLLVAVCVGSIMYIVGIIVGTVRADKEYKKTVGHLCSKANNLSASLLSRTHQVEMLEKVVKQKNELLDALREQIRQMIETGGRFR